MAFKITPPFMNKDEAHRKASSKTIREYNEAHPERKWISKAQAEANPELMPRYLEQAEMRRKGAEKKIAARKEKAMARQKMRETLEDMLSSDYEVLQEWLDFKFKKHDHKNASCTPDKTMDWFAERGRNLTVQDAVLLSVFKNAIDKGDLKSVEFIRDTIGEKPKVEIESNTNIKNVQGFTDLANSLFGEEKTEETEENKTEDE